MICNDFLKQFGSALLCISKRRGWTCSRPSGRNKSIFKNNAMHIYHLNCAVIQQGQSAVTLEKSRQASDAHTGKVKRKNLYCT